MIRGTTPIHIFNIPFEVTLIKELHVIYSQNDTVKILKTLTDCNLTGKTISVKLTQAETLGLNESSLVDIQVRVLTTDDTLLSTVVHKVSVGRCLENEVIV